MWESPSVVFGTSFAWPNRRQLVTKLRAKGCLMEARLPSGCRRLSDGAFEVKLHDGGSVTLSPADVETIGLLYDTVWIESEVNHQVEEARKARGEDREAECDLPFGSLTADGADRLLRLSERQLASLVEECVGAYEGEASYEALLTALGAGGAVIDAHLALGEQLDAHVRGCENKSLAETVAEIEGDAREDIEAEEETR